MSLILDEQFLSGFVTQSELDAYTGRLAAARERLHTPDGRPRAGAPSRVIPERNSSRLWKPQPGQSGKRRTSCW